MRSILRAVKRLLKPLYHRCAAPIYARVRAEMHEELLKLLAVVQQVEQGGIAASNQLGSKVNEVQQELHRMNRVYLDYHATLTQQVADEFITIRRCLQTPRSTIRQAA
jgi:hypothetical protein